MTPAIYTHPTVYAVCALPPIHKLRRMFVINVELRDIKGDRWAVLRDSDCLSASGQWEYEPQPSNRTDDWLAAHRFPLAQALALAKQAAPDLMVNGMTPADVLREYA